MDANSNSFAIRQCREGVEPVVQLMARHRTSCCLRGVLPFRGTRRWVQHEALVQSYGVDVRLPARPPEALVEFSTPTGENPADKVAVPAPKRCPLQGVRRPEVDLSEFAAEGATIDREATTEHVFTHQEHRRTRSFPRRKPVDRGQTRQSVVAGAIEANPTVVDLQTAAMGREGAKSRARCDLQREQTREVRIIQWQHVAVHATGIDRGLNRGPRILVTDELFDLPQGAHFARTAGSLSSLTARPFEGLIAGLGADLCVLGCGRLRRDNRAHAWRSLFVRQVAVSVLRGRAGAWLWLSLWCGRRVGVGFGSGCCRSAGGSGQWPVTQACGVVSWLPSRAHCQCLVVRAASATRVR